MAQICWWIFQIILLSQQLDGTGDMVQTKVKMLAGEFAVFFAIISGGMFYITRVFRRELKLAQNKKNFSLSITHELKTPITTTQLLVETLQNHELPAEKKAELYAKINQEQVRLHELIDKVLLSERLGSDNFKLTPKPTNLSVFLKYEINRLSFSNRISVTIEEDIFVMLDEFYFKSVIDNLLENAAKYSDNSTKIFIDLKKEADLCVMSVIDEGVGIPDEEKNKVFDVYYRLENEEIRNTAGTGLGLFLVKKIITLHKGAIRIKDRIGHKGTCIEVSLQLLK